ncbi:Uncharacterised protein [Klebsiella pneumoniae subsp. pneumoniae]|uniref:Uncharacterized protein n=1 Tax=Klebsiella pneumoniae subsp. pneumoniae TaxID=72407 RepID=A0A377ZD44_KLEPN|nr:Uncharacterised protein [Klebsiella pneumoniae subsp. pneumoniae]
MGIPFCGTHYSIPQEMFTSNSAYDMCTFPDLYEIDGVAKFKLIMNSVFSTDTFSEELLAATSEWNSHNDKEYQFKQYCEISINEIYIKKIIKTSRIDIFKKGGIYTFLNPVSYLQLRKTNLLDGFTGVFCDGGVLVKFINFFYREKLERFSFDMTSLAPMVFQYAVKNHKSIYIIGSDELSVDKAKKVIEVLILVYLLLDIGMDILRMKRN